MYNFLVYIKLLKKRVKIRWIFYLQIVEYDSNDLQMKLWETKNWYRCSLKIGWQKETRNSQRNEVARNKNYGPNKHSILMTASGKKSALSAWIFARHPQEDSLERKYLFIARRGRSYGQSVDFHLLSWWDINEWFPVAEHIENVRAIFLFL